MLKSYQATYENGQIHWLDDKPDIASARVLITILEEVKPTLKRTIPAYLAGQIRIIGDIVSPIVDEEDWECLK